MKIFYGWKLTAAGAGLHFLYAALLLQAFGAYVAVMSTELGWSKTALAMGAALQSIEGALLGPLLGWVIDRFGARIMIQAGVVCFAAGFLVLGFVQTLPGFYGAVMLLALGASLSGYFPLSVTVIRWFRRWRARALSLMALGMAAGGVVVPLIGWSMQHYGWRATAIGSAVAMLVLGLPLARMVHSQPADVGETVDGDPVSQEVTREGEGAGAEADPVPEFTPSQALRTNAFWLLGFGHAFALLVVTAVNVHAISHMHHGLGYSLAHSALFITLMTLAQVGGVLLGAAVGDRWNKRLVAAGCMLAHMTGLLFLTYATGPLMLTLFALLHGGAWGLRGPFMQAIRADYFGVRSIGMIMGLSGMIIAMGQVAGPLIAGVAADWSGHYRGGFTLLALIAGTGALLFALARKPPRPG